MIMKGKSMDSALGTLWTKEQDDLIVSLKKKGNSVKVIASLLSEIRPGATRNSVIGRLDRLGLIEKMPNDKKATFKKNKQNIESFDLSKIEGRWDYACALTSKKVKLEDLKIGQCHFPLGSLKDKATHFCGLPVHEKGYCEAHYDICFQKRREVNDHRKTKSLCRGRGEMHKV